MSPAERHALIRRARLQERADVVQYVNAVIERYTLGTGAGIRGALAMLRDEFRDGKHEGT